MADLGELLARMRADNAKVRKLLLVALVAYLIVVVGLYWAAGDMHGGGVR